MIDNWVDKWIEFNGCPKCGCHKSYEVHSGWRCANCLEMVIQKEQKEDIRRGEK